MTDEKYMESKHGTASHCLSQPPAYVRVGYLARAIVRRRSLPSSLNKINNESFGLAYRINILANSNY